MKIAEEEKRLVDRDIILRVVGEHITTASKRINDLPRVLAGMLPEKVRAGFIPEAEAEVVQILNDLADQREIEAVTKRPVVVKKKKNIKAESAND